MPAYASLSRPASVIRPSLRIIDPNALGLGMTSALLFLIVYIGAQIHIRVPYDLRAIQTVHDINAPWRDTILPRVEHLTDSSGAVLAWVVVLSAFVILLQWT